MELEFNLARSDEYGQVVYSAVLPDGREAIVVDQLTNSKIAVGSPGAPFLDDQW